MVSRWPRPLAAWNSGTVMGRCTGAVATAAPLPASREVAIGDSGEDGLTHYTVPFSPPRTQRAQRRPLLCALCVLCGENGLLLFDNPMEPRRLQGAQHLVGVQVLAADDE